MYIFVIKVDFGNIIKALNKDSSNQLRDSKTFNLFSFYFWMFMIYVLYISTLPFLLLVQFIRLRDSKDILSYITLFTLFSITLSFSIAVTKGRINAKNVKSRK